MTIFGVDLIDFQFSFLKKWQFLVKKRQFLVKKMKIIGVDLIDFRFSWKNNNFWWQNDNIWWKKGQFLVLIWLISDFHNCALSRVSTGKKKFQHICIVSSGDLFKKKKFPHNKKIDYSQLEIDFFFGQVVIAIKNKFALPINRISVKYFWKWRAGRILSSTALNSQLIFKRENGFFNSCNHHGTLLHFKLAVIECVTKQRLAASCKGYHVNRHHVTERSERPPVVSLGGRGSSQETSTSIIVKSVRKSF